MIRTWRLDDSRQTLVLGSQNAHLAEVVYWGPRLPDEADLEVVYRANAIDVTGGMLDLNPELRYEEKIRGAGNFNKIQELIEKNRESNIGPSIALYTCDNFYGDLNNKIREFLKKSDQDLKSDFDFQLCNSLIKDLKRLPSFIGKVYRGTDYRYSDHWKEG